MSDQLTPSSPEDIQKALMGGVPADKWTEGLLFDGISPTPGLKSAANWFPKTEKLGPDEMQIIFMGTAPAIRPGQMNTSVFGSETATASSSTSAREPSPTTWQADLLSTS